MVAGTYPTRERKAPKRPHDGYLSYEQAVRQSVAKTRSRKKTRGARKAGVGRVAAAGGTVPTAAGGGEDEDEDAVPETTGETDNLGVESGDAEDDDEEPVDEEDSETGELKGIPGSSLKLPAPVHDTCGHPEGTVYEKVSKAVKMIAAGCPAGSEKVWVYEPDGSPAYLELWREKEQRWEKKKGVTREDYKKASGRRRDKILR